MFFAAILQWSQRGRVLVWFIILFPACYTAIAQGTQPGPCFSVNGQRTATLIRGCAPFQVIVDNCSSNGISLSYNYNDGPPSSTTTHTYTQPGTYNLTQRGSFGDDTVGGSTGDSLTKVIVVLATPEPVFTINTCANRTVAVQITDNVYNSFMIEWGDGSTENDVPTGTYQHTYTNNINLPTTVTVSGRYAGIACGGRRFQAVNPIENLAPKLVSLTTTGSMGAEIRFEAEAGVLYRIEKRDENTGAGAGAYTQVATLTSASTGVVGQVLTGRQPATYRVVTVDACGTTKASDDISSIVLAATAADRENRLTWQTNSIATAPRDMVRNNGQTLVQIRPQPSATTYPDTDIRCGDEYCYQLEITLADGARSVSNSACVRAISSQVPPAIQNVIATVTSGDKVLLTWDNPSGNNSAKEFVISRFDTSGRYVDIARVTTNRYQDGDPRLDLENRCYRIRYLDNCGNASATSADACPIRLQARELNQWSGTGYQLAWSGYRPGGVQTYKVEKLNADNTVIETQDRSAGEYIFPLDTVNQLLRFRIRAIIGVGLVSESNIVEIRQDARLFVPQAFSPNDDNVNDVLEVKGMFIRKYRIVIYNRSGEAVFATDNRGISWNGKGGKENRYSAMIGAYSYIINAEDQIGRIIIKRGTVQLLR